MSPEKTAVIIGAGPAGLTAAYELLTRTDFKVIVLEADGQVGGLSRTVVYKGNRMDIGGHRFFSKSDRVMDWWKEMLPIEDPGLTGSDSEAGEVTITYHNRDRTVRISGSAEKKADTGKTMMVRKRLSRIFYGRKFYAYPVRLDGNTVRNLGLLRIAGIGFSYLRARIYPVKPERSLEDFFINRFGRRLYRTFFRDYTEKVWGVPCDRIKPEWGAQRIKGLSISGALRHFLRSLVAGDRDISQKRTETSLIERFLYPRLGPGQLWEEVAERVENRGGRILFNQRVTRLETESGWITGVGYTDQMTGASNVLKPDAVISTMPVSELIAAMGDGVPDVVKEVSSGLEYRDFIAVGLLFRNMLIGEVEMGGGKRVPDNWIYIQESDVSVGRIQVFNNWSPYLVSDPGSVWLGLEYFCREGDEMWILSDEELIGKGIRELERLGFCAGDDFLDGTVVRMPKTYPAYFGTYDRFSLIRSFTDSVENLFLVGRNGMHRYNNQDHSMLTAMTAVDLIISGRSGKSEIWDVNTEEDYHEMAGKQGS